MKPSHYKMRIQPIEYILANKLDFCSGNIVKYASRWDKKGEPYSCILYKTDDADDLLCGDAGGHRNIKKKK